MSGGLALMVDERMIIQGAIFIFALWVINYFFVSPLVKFYLERRKRIEGNFEEAELLVKSSYFLEKKYNDEINRSIEEARQNRVSLVIEGTHLGKELISKSQNIANNKVLQTLKESDEAIEKEKDKIEILSKDLSLSIIRCLNITPIILSFFIITTARGAASNLDMTYGVFWPLFQFVFFTSAGWFLGRNALTRKLQERRDNIRLKISEAQEVLHTAKAKSEFFEKKLQQLEVEKNEIKNGYIEDGRKEKEKIIEDAQETAKLILKNAERQVDEISKKARQQLIDNMLESAFKNVEHSLKNTNLENYNVLKINEIIAESEKIKNLV